MAIPEIPGPEASTSAYSTPSQASVQTAMPPPGPRAEVSIAIGVSDPWGFQTSRLIRKVRVDVYPGKNRQDEIDEIGHTARSMATDLLRRL